MSAEAHGRGGTRLRVRLTSDAERQVRGGHPWVFASSIREQNREGHTGELAAIYDKRDSFLAVGLFDGESPIRIRILHKGSPMRIDSEWFGKQLSRALEVRSALFGPDTTGYRIINGESDGWPGLVLDRYGSCLVLKLYSSSWFLRLNEITAIILALCAPDQLVLRLSRNIQEAAASQFKLRDGMLLFGALGGERVRFLESGLWLEADVVRGQKTGFFLDQRENRAYVAGFAKGKDALNAFSFSGGFSLYAARGGARSVLDLDISAHALESSKRNHQLNIAHPNVAACKREWIQADVFVWLEKNCRARSFDIVILDPPSMAKRESERAGALRAYSRLATLGAECLRPGGLLACFSCSAHVTDQEFCEAALIGASSVACFTEHQRSAHAPDHPATIPEAKYLKGIYLVKQG